MIGFASVRNGIVLLTLLVATTNAPAQDPPPAAPPPVAIAPAAIPGEHRLLMSRQGVVLLDGTPLPNMNRLRARVLAAAWGTDEGKRVMREAGLSEEAARDALQITANAGVENILLVLELQADGDNVRKAGKAFLDALADRVVVGELKAMIQEANAIPVERAAGALETARRRAAQASDEAAKQRQVVRQAAQVLDPSPDAVRQAASRLDQERQRITLELAGQAARQRALEERVAKLSEAAAARVDKDEIAAELDKIVKLREREAALRADLRAQKTISESDVAAAQAQLAEARARLFERREAAARAAGTDLLGELNKELVTLTITIAENQARLKYVEGRLDGLSQALERVDSLEQAIAAEGRARRQVEAAEQQLHQLQARMDARPDLGAAINWDDVHVSQRAN